MTLEIGQEARMFCVVRTETLSRGLTEVASTRLSRGRRLRVYLYIASFRFFFSFARREANNET